MSVRVCFHALFLCIMNMCCVQTKGALAAAAAASAVAAQVARGRGRAALARGAFVSAAAPGYVTPGRGGIYSMCVVLLFFNLSSIFFLFGWVRGSFSVFENLCSVRCFSFRFDTLVCAGLALQY